VQHPTLCYPPITITLAPEVLRLKRREFITLLGGAAAWPRVARAQRAAHERRIGILLAFAQSDVEFQRRVAVFRQELRKLGWSEANLRIDERWAADDMNRVRANATDLISLKPDAILVGGRRALSVLQEQTRSIPVVFAGITDPVEQEIVTNLARPGGNITGFSYLELSIFGKILEILKQMAPNVTRVALVFNPDNATALLASRSFAGIAVRLAVQPTLIPVHEPTDIERSIDGFASQPNGGLFFPPDVTIYIHRQLVTAQVARHRLPAIYTDPVMVKAGGLISYGPDLLDIFRRAASYVDRILRGEKPGDLPVQQPAKFELIINLKTAKTLDLNVPPILLATADEVIE
jgi:putative ABC transport system substrate-binding protein